MNVRLESCCRQILDSVLVVDKKSDGNNFHATGKCNNTCKRHEDVVILGYGSICSQETVNCNNDTHYQEYESWCGKVNIDKI